MKIDLQNLQKMKYKFPPASFMPFWIWQLNASLYILMLLCLFHYLNSLDGEKVIKALLF